MRLRVFTEPQMGASYDDQLAMALAAEEMGFDAFFRSDHYIAFGPGDGLPGPTDAWATLAGLARDTERIRLGTLVSPVTFRFPGPLAITVAQVDQMSGGRVELGLGAGWNEAEHRAHAIPFPPRGVRFEMLEDQLEIVTGMWRTPAGGRFSHTGRHHSVVDSPALPKPVQDGGPPIVVGGAGAVRTPRLAARFAAEFNTPFLPPDAAGAAYRRVAEACEAQGRDPSTITFSAATTVVCGRDDDELARRAAAMGATVSDLRGRITCGTPEEVLDAVGRYGEAGASTVYLQLLDIRDVEHVRLLGDEVLPRA